MKRLIFAAFMVCLLATSFAFGQENEPTLEEIREQLKALQEQMREMAELYQLRIEVLEEQIQQLEQRQDEEQAEETADAPPDVPEGMVPPAPSGRRSLSLMNPAISVIPDFTYSVGNDPTWEEADPFQIREVEVAFSASIDPIASASVYLALEDGELDAEEAFAVFPGVPGGFTVKLGKFKMNFGKQNTMHTHSWFQANQPLALRTMLGEEGLADVGLSVNRLVPTPWFSDVTIEVAGGGNDEVFGDRSDLSYLGAWRHFWDLSDDSNLEAQLSLVTGGNAMGNSTDLGNLAVTWRYKPLASATRASFLWRTEVLFERYQGADVPEGGFDDGFEGVIGTHRSTGAFSYVDWQFTRGWFLGARADYAEHPWDPSKHDTGGALTLSWFPSEFQKLRLQAERIDYDDYGPRSALVLEYIFAIGAHGAHPF